MKYGVVEGSLTQLLPKTIERIRFFDSLRSLRMTYGSIDSNLSFGNRNRQHNFILRFPSF